MEAYAAPVPSSDFKQAGAVPFKWEIRPGIPRSSSTSSSAPPSPSPHQHHLRPPPPGSTTIFSSFSGVLTPASSSSHRFRSSRSLRITSFSPSPSIRSPSSISSSSSSSIQRRTQSNPISLGCFLFRTLRRRVRGRGAGRSSSGSSSSSGCSSTAAVRNQPFDTVSEVGSPVRACSSPPSPLSGVGESPVLVGRSLSSSGESPRFARVSPRAFSSFRESPVASYDPSYHNPLQPSSSFQNDLEWATYGLF
ncbi:unnamed protein product [Victoria cruziana]